MIKKLNMEITEKHYEKLRGLAAEESKSVEEYILAMISHALGMDAEKLLDEIDAQKTIEEMAEYGMH